MYTLQLLLDFTVPELSFHGNIQNVVCMQTDNMIWIRINISCLSQNWIPIFIQTTVCRSTHSLRGSFFLSERSYHVHDFKVAIGEGNGIGWSGHRQHESQRGRDGAGKHDVQRVYLNGSGLEIRTFTQI